MKSYISYGTEKLVRFYFVAIKLYVSYRGPSSIAREAPDMRLGPFQTTSPVVESDFRKHFFDSSQSSLFLPR